MSIVAAVRTLARYVNLPEAAQREIEKILAELETPEAPQVAQPSSVNVTGAYSGPPVVQVTGATEYVAPATSASNDLPA